jgi:two-component system chemotaxis sensor kinase CheA
MTEPTERSRRVDGLLTRLSCDSLVEPVSIEQFRAQLFVLATAVGESTGVDAQALSDRIRDLALDLVPATVGATVEDILAGWESVNAGEIFGFVESPARTLPLANPSAEAAPDDELATLASDRELASMFVTEALDHLGTIESAVLQLESSPGDTKLLNDVFRPFHTVKGNAGALGVTSVQEMAHTVENLLDLARSGKHAMGPDEFDVVLKAVDLLTLMIQELPDRLSGGAASDVSVCRRTLMEAVDALIARGPGAAATTLAESGAPAVVEGDVGSPSQPLERRHDAHSTVKVDTRKLDNFVDMVGELVIAQSILAEDPALIRSADERLLRQLAQLKRITSDLQRNAMSMRMVPIRQTFQKMARLVRDLSKKSGKNIELTLSGEETELDRKIVEDINDPLMHMVRNSVDHGIETASVRAAAGKPAQAALALRAFHRAGYIVIEIADDGAGLDTARIVAKAIAQGLVPEGTTMAAADIHHLIFQPGFSTAEVVTEISGRGVGMDVVRRNIDALRGRIDIETARGQGTTFSIRLPLTLAIVDGILLGVGDERFVIPTFAVRESLRPTREQVHSVHGQPCLIQVRERLIPLLHLGEAFAAPGVRRAVTDSTVVVIEDNGRPVALVVDELLGKQEVVIKSLGAAFKNVRGVAGGAILGDGRIGLILDAGGLVGMMKKTVVASAA